jgi:hypothetical protein
MAAGLDREEKQCRSTVGATYLYVLVPLAHLTFTTSIAANRQQEQ